MGERRYSETEVARILEEAVRPSPGTDLARRDAGLDLSLNELKVIGREVGIDPVRIEAAARGLDRADMQVRRILGIPLVAQQERWVDAPLDPDHLPDLVALIRRIAGIQGTVSEVLGGVEWRGKSAVGPVHVTIRPDAGGTRLHLMGSFREAVLGGFLGTGPLGGIFAGVGASTLGWAALTFPPAVAAGVAAAALPWALSARAKVRLLRNVADRLEHELLARAERGALDRRADEP
ncbi:MAG: hypothetical protein R3E10_14125 [Gemmatimonadota bacterium]